MKAPLLWIALVWSTMSVAQERSPSLDWTTYQDLMAGHIPVEVRVPTEIERAPQSVINHKRLEGKELRRAPAIVLEKEEVVSQ